MSKIYGDGLIAKRFMDYALRSNYQVFAGSIHDSSVNDQKAFEAEEAALTAALADNTNVILYFSSCSLLDPDMVNSPYTQHKRRMENLVTGSSRKHFILRLPQLMGADASSSNLLNFIFDSVLNDREIKIWTGATRNFIDIDDVHSIVTTFLDTNPTTNKTLNIANPFSSRVIDAVEAVETFLDKKAVVSQVEKGTSYLLDISETEHIIEKLNINFSDSYILKSLRKYFSYKILGPKLLSVVVPTYNEEHGIDEFYRRTKRVLEALAPRFTHEIIFVNDRSTDRTLSKIEALATRDASVKVIHFSRNFGNQIGITAGIDHAQGEVVVVIDDDLQDPPEIILNFLAKWSAPQKTWGEPSFQNYRDALLSRYQRT